MSLTDLYQKLASHDEILQAEQYEMLKVAEEEDAAGRIMARGFMDELEKLSAPLPTIASTSPNANQRGAAAMAGRTFGQKPSVMGEMPAKGSAGAKTPGSAMSLDQHMAEAPGGAAAKPQQAQAAKPGLAFGMGRRFGLPQQGQGGSAAPVASPGANKPMVFGENEGTTINLPKPQPKPQQVAQQPGNRLINPFG